MARSKFITGACALVAAVTLSGCGFKPIYATTDEGGAALVHRIAIASVAAPEAVAPVVSDALESRMKLEEGASPKYELFVSVRESAQQLAVQIDASVTRYNYRLNARYSVVDLESGKRTNGRALAVTSFNIVNSQYSTLFAERSAVEKAASQLAAEIERDLLIRFASENTALENEADQREDFLEGTESDLLPEIRRQIDRRRD